MSLCVECNAPMHPADASVSLLCVKCRGFGHPVWAHIRKLYQGLHPGRSRKRSIQPFHNPRISPDWRS